MKGQGYIEYDNLDAIISVGYRVKSKRGVAFRKWATSVLDDYLLKGYAENKRLLEAQGKTIELQARMISLMQFRRFCNIHNGNQELVRLLKSNIENYMLGDNNHN